jgi:molecular chaperone Hsp33
LREKIVGYLERKLQRLPPVSIMVLDGLSPKEIMEEAVGLPIEIYEWKEVFYYCPCTKDRVLDAIVALGKKDMEELASKEEVLNVQCEFCKTEYVVSKDELLLLLHSTESLN